MPENQTPAGWYADPAGDPTKIRYWDGQNWTEQLKDAGVSAAAPSAPVETMPAYQDYQNTQANPYAPAQPVQQQPTYTYQQQQPGYQPQVPGAVAGGKDQKGLAIAGLICACVGIPAGLFIPLIGLACGILGVIFGIKGRKSSKAAIGTASLIVGIVALVASCAAWAVYFAAAL
jgi:hypothetical protein